MIWWGGVGGVGWVVGRRLRIGSGRVPGPGPGAEVSGGIYQGNLSDVEWAGDEREGGWLVGAPWRPLCWAG